MIIDETFEADQNLLAGQHNLRKQSSVHKYLTENIFTHMLRIHTYVNATSFILDRINVMAFDTVFFQF